MNKILFLHGFYASGQCVPAVALQEALEGRAEVLTPDLPMHPKEAIRYIREVIDLEKPDLLVGNSCGSFYAQMLAPIVGIPALLGNPHCLRLRNAGANGNLSGIVRQSAVLGASGEDVLRGCHP